MKNLDLTERVVRGVLGLACVAVGLSAGRRAWWGILLDALGTLALFSAATGFCHVRKVIGDLRAAPKA